MLEFLTDQGQPQDISDTNIILAKFHKVRQDAELMLLLGTFIELVDREVILEQKELLVNTVIGVIKNKAEYVRRRVVPFVKLHLM